MVNIYSLIVIVSVLTVLACFYINLIYKKHSHSEEKDGDIREIVTTVIIDALVATFAFLITLNWANNDERQLDRMQAAEVLQNLSNYTKTICLKSERYYANYQDGTTSLGKLRVSDVITTDYYKDVLSTEMCSDYA